MCLTRSSCSLYSVWATVARADGTTLITSVEEDVYAGMAVALAVEVHARPRLRATGQEAWSAAQPLRVCLRAKVVNVERTRQRSTATVRSSCRPCPATDSTSTC